MKYREFRGQVYNQFFSVVIYKSKKTMEKERRKNKDPNYRSRMATILDNENPKFMGQIITHKKMMKKHPELLFHEAVHIAYSMIRKNENKLKIAEFISKYGYEEMVATAIESVAKAILIVLRKY